MREWDRDYIIRTVAMITKIPHKYAQSETSSAEKQWWWNTMMPLNNLSFPNNLLTWCLNFSDKGFLRFKFVSYTGNSVESDGSREIEALSYCIPFCSLL